MPNVTLFWEHPENAPTTLKTSHSSQAGCFGFTGRSALSASLDPQGSLSRAGFEVVKYRYHFNHSWYHVPQQSKGIFDPKPYLLWVAKESMWAKYVHNIHLPSGVLRGENAHGEVKERYAAHVDIKTDIPGHFVVGTASAFRLGVENETTLVPFWNLAVKAGCDPMIALLTFYARFTNSTPNVTCNYEKGKLEEKERGVTLRTPILDHSAVLGLADNEVFTLNDVDPELLYEMIDGTASFLSDDNDPYEPYSKTRLYSQNILNSYKRSMHRLTKAPITSNFSTYILDRFYKPLAVQHTALGLKNSYGNRREATITREYSMSANFLLGVACQLSFEYKNYDKFLGWSEEI